MELISLILIAFLIYFIYTKYILKENFSTYIEGGSQIKTNDELINKLRTTRLVFLKMGGCGYCDKQNQLFKDLGVSNYVDMVTLDSSRGTSLAQNYNIKGFPAFINLETNKSSTGYREDIDSLLSELS